MQKFTQPGKQLLEDTKLHTSIDRRSLLKATAAAIAVPTGITSFTRGAWASAGEVNVLAFTGYQEPGMLEDFERETGIRVNLRIHSGSNEEVIAILRTSQPGEWDVVTPTSAYVPMAVREGLVHELNPSDFPLEDYFDLIANWPLCWQDGKLYAIINRFGYYGIIYNTEKYTAEDCSTWNVLFSERARGRVALFDWYLPNMGVLSKALGNPDPYDIDSAAFEALTARLMELRPQVGLVTSLAQVIQAMASQSFDLSIGGEFIQAGMANDGLPYGAVVPREGGVTWDQAPCISATTTRYDNALKFLQYVAGPRFQSRLAVAEAYFSMVPNRRAIDLLSAEHQALLNLDDVDRFEAVFMSNLSPRVEPADKEEWMRVWEAFKAA